MSMISRGTHPKKPTPKKERASLRNTPGRHAFTSPVYTPSEAWRGHQTRKAAHERKVRAIMRHGFSRMFAEHAIANPEDTARAYPFLGIKA